MKNHMLVRKTKSKGITMLPLVIMIGLIIMELGIAIAFVAYWANSSSNGSRLAQEALLGAKAGIDDAILRLVRDKDLDSTQYVFTAGTRTQVSVTINNDLLNNQATINSVGTVLLRQKKYQAVVSINPETAVVSLISLTEI
ncbi:MAG TPA: DUF2371 domain-containing protein [Candidatus Paceibacterota bacterium]|nr:DUF2371 domain-containing protein [Candidatus Paceibacterota bacterium]